MKQIPKNLSIMAIALVAVSLTGSFAIADEFQGGQIAEQEAGIYGHITAKVLDENGDVKQYTQSDNAIVRNGVDMLVINTLVPSDNWAASGIDTTLGEVQWMQVGDGAVAPAATDNTITFITGCIPVTFTGTGTGASGDPATTSVTLSATFSGATCADIAVAEAGLFDGATGTGTDDMFSRGVFGVTVNLGAADSLDVDWTFTFTDT